VKQYRCKYINEEITIDGNFSKPVWQNADEIQLVNNADGKEPRQQTTAKMLWNDNFLYAAFRCIDDEIIATMTGYNDPIYNEEVVEIFIDDDCDKKTYIEIEVSPLNTLLHYAVHNNLNGEIITFARVEKILKTAVVHNKDRGFWDVEIAIPFSEIILDSVDGPKKDSQWRVNLYRIDRRQNGERELSAWSPTLGKTFHMPDKFGELIFVR